MQLFKLSKISPTFVLTISFLIIFLLLSNLLISVTTIQGKIHVMQTYESYDITWDAIPKPSNIPSFLSNFSSMNQKINDLHLKITQFDLRIFNLNFSLPFYNYSNVVDLYIIPNELLYNVLNININNNSNIHSIFFSDALLESVSGIKNLTNSNNTLFNFDIPYNQSNISWNDHSLVSSISLNSAEIQLLTARRNVNPFDIFILPDLFYQWILKNHLIFNLLTWNSIYFNLFNFNFPVLSFDSFINTLKNSYIELRELLISEYFYSTNSITLYSIDFSSFLFLINNYQEIKTSYESSNLTIQWISAPSLILCFFGLILLFFNLHRPLKKIIILFLARGGTEKLASKSLFYQLISITFYSILVYVAIFICCIFLYGLSINQIIMNGLISAVLITILLYVEYKIAEKIVRDTVKESFSTSDNNSFLESNDVNLVNFKLVNFSVKILLLGIILSSFWLLFSPNIKDIFSLELYYNLLTTLSIITFLLCVFLIGLTFFLPLFPIEILHFYQKIWGQIVTIFTKSLLYRRNQQKIIGIVIFSLFAINFSLWNISATGTEIVNRINRSENIGDISIDAKNIPTYLLEQILRNNTHVKNWVLQYTSSITYEAYGYLFSFSAYSYSNASLFYQMATWEDGTYLKSDSGLKNSFQELDSDMNVTFLSDFIMKESSLRPLDNLTATLLPNVIYTETPSSLAINLKVLGELVNLPGADVKSHSVEAIVPNHIFNNQSALLVSNVFINLIPNSNKDAVKNEITTAIKQLNNSNVQNDDSSLKNSLKSELIFINGILDYLNIQFIINYLIVFLISIAWMFTFVKDLLPDIKLFLVRGLSEQILSTLLICFLSGILLGFIVGSLLTGILLYLILWDVIYSPGTGTIVAPVPIPLITISGIIFTLLSLTLLIVISALVSLILVKRNIKRVNNEPWKLYWI